jgi:hypothetical protein
MKNHTLLISALFVFFGSSAFAQTATPTVGVSYWKCNFAHMGKLTGAADSLLAPIAQELVDEGSLYAFGTLTHTWGDEWNLVFYWTAEDIPAFLDAWQEMTRRINERHPDAFPITDYCTDHKDNIYTQVAGTQPPSGM